MHGRQIGADGSSFGTKACRSAQHGDVGALDILLDQDVPLLDDSELDEVHGTEVDFVLADLRLVSPLDTDLSRAKVAIEEWS